MDATETLIAKKDDGPIDSYWNVVWTRMGCTTDDVTA